MQQNELRRVKDRLREALAVVDVLLGLGPKVSDDVGVTDMISFCLEKEKDSTFNADFACKMDEVMKKYNKLTEGQHRALVKHHALAQSWK